MAKSSNTGEPKKENGEPKARRTPARRRTDKAAPAAASRAAEMNAVAAPADLAPIAPGRGALQAETTAAARTPMKFNGPSAAEIQRRAYELYLRRGGQDGRDLEDWLEAERQLRGH
jgi:hypothetical protein